MFAETAFLIPLNVYILHGYIAALPAELAEAAVLDGASLRALLWYVILPAISQGMIALAVIIFVLSWNQFFLPLVLTTGTQIRPLPVMIRGFFILERDFEWSQAAAVLTLSLLPVAVIVAGAYQALSHFRLEVSDMR
jgi:ABC-type glycerol-3-phosphate transport system permease component